MTEDVLERYEDLLILAVFGEVNAHSFQAISGEERNKGGIFLFHLISDILKGLPHGILDHLLFGLLDLLESLVEVGENLGEEGRVGLVERLFDGHDALLI